MISRRKRSPYLKDGRLPDVIAALQIMGAGERPENWIKGWAKELSHNESDAEVNRWTTVFSEHPEFFLVYEAGVGGKTGRDASAADTSLKSALRWRYTNKLYDAKTGEEYTPQAKEELPDKERWLLTTKPLTSDAIAALMNTAIELYSTAVEELAASRWWVPLLAAFLGFVGALLGAIVAALWGVHR